MTRILLILLLFCPVTAFAGNPFGFGDMAWQEPSSVAITGGQITGTALYGDGSNLWGISGGSGAVDSVNGETGTVVLDTGDVNDVSDRRYCTDAQKVVIGNTSGTNSGDMSNAAIKTAYESNADTNEFDDDEQTKLAGIAAGAEVNVNADWDASSGDAEIENKPDIQLSTNVNIVGMVTTTAYMMSKPSISSSMVMPITYTAGNHILLTVTGICVTPTSINPNNYATSFILTNIGEITTVFDVPDTAQIYLDGTALNDGDAISISSWNKDRGKLACIGAATETLDCKCVEGQCEDVGEDNTL